MTEIYEHQRSEPLGANAHICECGHKREVHALARDHATYTACTVLHCRCDLYEEWS